jgi:ribosomal protein L30
MWSRPLSTASPSSLLRVKLSRGLIGLPAKVGEHALALGLRKTHQKVYLPATPSTVGNILKLKELVQVRPVKGCPAPNAKYWAKGYSLVRKREQTQ